MSGTAGPDQPSHRPGMILLTTPEIKLLRADGQVLAKAEASLLRHFHYRAAAASNTSGAYQNTACTGSSWCHICRASP
jgi:hypothetical protein